MLMFLLVKQCGINIKTCLPTDTFSNAKSLNSEERSSISFIISVIITVIIYSISYFKTRVIFLQICICYVVLSTDTNEVR